MRTPLARLHEWVSRLRGVLGRSRTDRDLEEELTLHLELAAEDARQRGASPERARRAARIAAGGVAQAMESMRDQRGLPWLDDLARDLRHGVHLLRRSPAFTAAAVVSLALGIGANTAVFSFADALLLRPLAVPRASDVLTVGSSDNLSDELSASYREYIDIRDRSTSFEGLAAFRSAGAAFAAEPDTLPKLSIGLLVSANFFRVMGVEPQLGRDFRPDEDAVPGRDALVVLGHDFWEREFGADRSILGRTVRLNGIAFTVIGVAPAGFSGPDQYVRFQFYAPLMMWPRLVTEANEKPLEARDFRSLEIRGRLEKSVTLAQARAEIAGIGRDLEQAYPDTNRNRTLAVATELESRMAEAPPLGRLLAMLSMLAAAVLLVACANVAGLLTSRAPLRAREIALRMAIGAGRFRVIRQLITESVLIAVIGGAAGLGVGYAGVTLFRQVQFPTDLPISPSFDLDRRALLVSLVVALVSAVLFGLAPAIRSARTDLNSVMKASDAARDGRRRWGRAVLVSVQVAVSVVLLVVAAFTYRGFQQQLGNGPGIRIERVLMMGFNPGLLRYSDAQALRFFEQVVERTRSVRGVESAALASYVPMDGGPPRITMIPEGFELPPGQESVTILASVVDEHYFATLGLPILNGRGFRATDAAGAPGVVIVNELAAERYWPGQDPIGKRVRLHGSRGPWVEIVGVARNSKYSFLTEPPREFVYLPYRQQSVRPMVLFAATAGDPASLVTPLRDVVRSLDANQPVYNVRTFEELYRMRVVVFLNLISRLVGAMGMMGLILALVGLYALVAYAASRRTKEIGIRMAIGAARADVLRMVLRQGVVFAIAGLGVGLAASVGVDKGLRAMFAGGVAVDGQLDVLAFVLVAASVLAVTLLAAYIPARRASRINPTDALRYE